MSEAASVPFSETKAPESPDRLHRGALGLIDISASTMANIGPAYSFYFGFAFLVATAGVAAPLTIIAAVVAIALLGNTLSQFSRAHPSTGGFISFVGKSFGGTSAVTTALLCGAGYIIAISSVLAVSGGFVSDILQYYFHWNVPWIIFSVLLTGGAVWMTIRGVGVSTKLAGAFFAFEMLVLVVVSVVAIPQERRAPVHGAVPVEQYHQRVPRPGGRVPAGGLPVHRLGELRRAGRGDRQPAAQRAAGGVLVHRMMGVGYVLFAYATLTGFHYNATALAGTTVPFITVAHNALAGFAFFAYMAGLTSTLGVLIAAINSQARLIFNAGREWLLPPGSAG